MSFRDMFSKSKKKRSRTPTGDSSEQNHAFVRNVKSRVSGLVPAIISQWFSSNLPTSTGNGSTPTVEMTDSSEDEPEPTPPAKRKRYNSQETQYNQCFQSEPTPLYTDNAETPSSHNVLYTSIQSPSSQHTFTREANYASSRYIATPDKSDTEPAGLDTTERDVPYKLPVTASTLGQSVAPKRKSIFESVGNVKNDDKKIKSCAQAGNLLSEERPRFRPSLYSSPFYPGPTMYGGASACTYVNHPIINHQKVKVREAHKTSYSELSSSSRRILDLLENCSSPLSDARRIPVYNRKQALEQNTSLPSTSKLDSYKTQEMNMPSVASILRLKQHSRLMDTTKVARQIIASHSSTLSGFHPYIADGTGSDASRSTEKVTPKLKTRLTRANRGEDPLTMPEPVQLPTAVLQIDKDNLPKFTITPPMPRSSTTVPSTPPAQPLLSFNNKTAASETNSMSSFFTNTTVSKTSPRASSEGSMFKFANPAVCPVATTQDFQIFSKITFGSDEPIASEETRQSSIFLPKNIETPVITSTFESLKDWRCSECWVNNKFNEERCVACGGKRPSNADMCTQGQRAPAPAPAPFNMPSPPPDDLESDDRDWKCDNCYIKNKSSVKKCAACGGSNPNGKESTTFAPVAPVKPADEDWRCEICCIKNKGSENKCAACGGPMPGGKEQAAPAPQPEAHSSLYKPPDGKLAEIVRAQKGKWECPGCLIRNDPDKTKCQCCEMEREGPSKEITPKPFTFPKESNINFKFGIDPTEQQKNIAKKAEQGGTPRLNTPEQAETNNNNKYVVEFPQLAYNKFDEMKPDNKNDDNDSVVPEGPTVTFSFGIPKTTPKPSTDSTALVERLTEKPKLAQDTPFAFGAGFLSPPKTELASSSKSFPSFGVAATSMAAEPKPNTATVGPTLVNKNEANNEVKDANATFCFTNASSDKPKSFTFGGESGAASFGSTATSATSAFSFGVPSQSAPAAPTVAPAATLFSSGQPAAPAAPAAGKPPAAIMFGSTEPASAPNPAMSPAAPVFSIRSDGPSAQPTPAFSFGSANNNDNKPSPFGSGFKAPGPSTSFAMSTAAPAPLSSGTLDGGISDMGSSMSGPNESGINASNSVFRTGASFGAGGGGPACDMQPFGFSAVGNQFSASSGAGAVAVNASPLFGAPQPAPGGQGVFGMPSAGASGGLFGNTPQPAPPGTMFGAQPTPALFSAPTQPATFGAPMPTQSATFGAPMPTQPPAFGAPPQSQPPVFGSPAQNQPTVFGAPAQSQPPTFGSPAQSQPTFGAPAPSQPAAFGAPAQPAAPFGFGSSTVFSFGQQQTPQFPAQQSQPSSVYSFGGGTAMGGMNTNMGGGMMAHPMDGNMGGGGVQFNMGSGSTPGGNMRRMRKAVRRNTAAPR